jgi:hypothetical protein
MDFERPNNSRTSNKRDEIRAAYSPRLDPAGQEIARICGELATSRRLKLAH